MSHSTPEPNASESNFLLNAIQCQRIVDVLPEALQIFKALRNGLDELTGYQVLFANAKAQQMFPENTIGSHNTAGEVIGKQSLFLEKLRKVASTGSEIHSQMIFQVDGQETTFNERIVRVDDTVLVIHNPKLMLDGSSQEEAHLLRGISETSADILYIMDINTHQIRFGSRSIAQVLGYTQEQIEKMHSPLFDLMHEDDVPAMRLHVDNMKTAVRGEVREIEYRMRHADGTLRFYRDRNTVFKTDAFGVPVEKLGIAQDISEEYIQRAKLRRHDSMLSQCEEISNSGSWEYDRKSKEMTWSDGMYRLFEIEKGTPITPSIYLEYVLAKDKAIAERLVKVMELHWEDEEFVFRIRTKSATRTIKVKTISLGDSSHLSDKVLGVDMDITASRKSEENIQNLNKTLLSKNKELEALNSELKTFNDIAANDYKETLRSLYINLENIIKADAQTMSDTGKANVRKAQTAIQKMKLLTEDIVSFSRIPTIDSKVVAVNLNEILQSVLVEMDDKIKSANARIEVETLPNLQGMPALLSLLFYHILDNSLKFRKEETAPSIIIEGREPAESTDPDIRYYEISFTDNGIGFEASEGENLFSIFYRLHERQYKGSGIGLAVCRKIMALHGGYITAEGETGIGATITCYFPAEAE